MEDRDRRFPDIQIGQSTKRVDMRFIVVQFLVVHAFRCAVISSSTSVSSVWTDNDTH